MEKYSKYNLIKAILASNLEEEVKEAIVDNLISSYYRMKPTNDDNGYRFRNLVYAEDTK